MEKRILILSLLFAGGLFILGAKAQITAPSIPANCQSWFDGCNNCTVDTGGKLGACTMMYCDAANLKTPKCLKYFEKEAEQKICTMDWNPVCGTDKKTYSNACTAEAAGAKVASKGECKVVQAVKIPAGCVSWYDGCNNCMVKDGKIGGCTKKMCVRQDTPKCLVYSYGSEQGPTPNNNELKALKARVDAQQKEINNLKEQIKLLNKRLNKLNVK